MHALMDKWLPDALEYIREPYRLLRDGQMRWQDFGRHKIVPCNWLWKSTVVNWDGTVGPCCGSWGTDQEFGDINKEPLARIWNGASYRAGRRSFKGTGEDSVVCSRCPGTLL
jgi:radical SAM protein with 4Fe4S-binding SPASM domain